MATGSDDPTERIIAGLAEPTRTRAFLLVYAARQAGIPIIVTSGRRSIDAQRDLVRMGRSRTLRSKHLEGQAFDIDLWRVDRSAVSEALWATIGPWAERYLGLKWGGRWSSIYDPAHFES